MLKEKLAALWRGEIPLPNTFWTYCIGASLIYAFITFLVTGLGTYSLTLDDIKKLYIIMTCILFIYCPYMIVALIGLWRSSDRYEGSSAWKILAKLFVISSFLKMFKGALELWAAWVALSI